MNMDSVRWTIAAMTCALLMTSGVAVAGETLPLVTLDAGTDFGVPSEAWPHNTLVDDAPVRILFDDEDLSVSAVVSGATTTYWYWEYTLQGRSNSIDGACGHSNGLYAECSTDATPPAITDLPAAPDDGYYTYFLTYEASNGGGTTVERLEVRVLPAVSRPAVSLSDAGPTLAAPFTLSGACSNCEAPLPNNSDPVQAWTVDGVDAGDASEITVDVTGRSHGDPVTVAFRAFSYPTAYPDLQLHATHEVTKTLDLAPVFTVTVPGGAAGDTLTPTLGVTYPSGSVSESYEWSLGGTVVGTGSSLELTDGDFQRGDVVTLAVTLTNDAEGASRTVTETVTVGNAAPVVEAVTVTPTDPQASQDLGVSVVGHDADGDALTYTYQWLKDGVDASGQTGATLPASATAVGEAWSVRVTASDGTAASAPATSNAATILPPAPTVSITGPTADVWQTSTSVPVTFTTTGGSVTTECSVDGGTTFSACQSGDALNVGGDGTHSIVVRATNAAGTATDSRSVKVDATGPVVTIAPSRAPDSGDWYTSAVTFTASGTDAGSGVDSCDAAKEHANGDGADRTVTLTCKDEVGNVGSATHTFDFDASAPSVGVTVPQWTKGGQVTFQVSDAGSGVASWSAQYRVDGGDWQSLGGTGTSRDLPSTTEGATIDFRVTATDSLGHARALPTAPDASTTIDKTAPGVPAAFQVGPRAGGAFSLSWSAPSVDGAPIDRYVVQHRAVGGSFSTLGSPSERSYVANLGASDASGHEFRVAAVDEAGNQGDFTSITSAVAHNRAPTGTLTVASPTHGDGAAAGDEVRFSWTALIAGPGEAITYRYALSQQETLQLDADALSTTSTTAQFNDVQPGTWYFHLLGVGTTGSVPAQPLRIEVFAAVTDAQLAAANKALLVTVEERAEDVLVSWTLPDDLPGTVAGVQVWSVDEDGDLTLRRTITSDDDEFTDRAYATRPAEAFVVTLFYEHGEGRFSLQAPPSSDQYTAWEPESDARFTEAKSGDDGLSLRAVLYTGGAVVLLAGLATGGFFLVRARSRAAEPSPY